MLTEQGRKLDQRCSTHWSASASGSTSARTARAGSSSISTRGGGYYFNVGCSDLIVERKVGWRSSRTSRLRPQACAHARGERIAADLVVLATGYKGRSTGAKLFGDAVAARVGPIWGFDAQQELRNMYVRTPQPALWFIAGSFAQCRIYSKYLGLQIKAQEAGCLRRPHRREELIDLALEVVAVARERLRRGEHLRGGRTGLAGAAIDVGDLGGDLAVPCAARSTLRAISRGRGALLLDRGRDRRGDLGDAADGAADLLDGATDFPVAACIAPIWVRSRRSPWRSARRAASPRSRPPQSRGPPRRRAPPRSWR
jgi:hypothetical protein